MFKLKEGANASHQLLVGHFFIFASILIKDFYHFNSIEHRQIIICPSVCLSVRPFVCLSAHIHTVPISLSVRPFICLSMQLAIIPFVCLSIQLDILLFVSLLVCSYVCLPIQVYFYLSGCQSIQLSFYPNGHLYTCNLLAYSPVCLSNQITFHQKIQNFGPKRK